MITIPIHRKPYQTSFISISSHFDSQILYLFDKFSGEKGWISFLSCLPTIMIIAYFCGLMDSITHIVTGAVIGELLLGKKVGKTAMLWGAIAASAPDIDVINNFFVNDVDAVVLHRGITHSVFTALLFGPVFGWLLWKFHKKKEATIVGWTLLVTVNLLFHLFLDTCTVYGTGLLNPFTTYKFGLDNIFVADPVFTLPFIIAFIALLILHRGNGTRRTWALSTLAIGATYLIFTFVNHHKAERAIQTAIQKQGINSEGTIVSPTLLNNILWNLMAKDSTGYWLGYYSIFDGDKIPELYFVPQNEKLLVNVVDDADLKKLKQFAQGYYSVNEKDGKLWFNIMRFGQINGWDNRDANFAFAFDLTPGSDNSIVVQAGRIEGSKSAVLRSMWERLKGLE